MVTSTNLAVLLVDDDAAVRDLFGEALRGAGHRVVLSGHGLDALERVDAGSFDVLLCDIRLPGMDGVSLLQHARLHAPQMDVILMTGHAGVADAVAALKAGANDYLSKPFSVQELTIRLERIGNERRLRRELEQAKAELSDKQDGPLLGRSPLMVRLLERIRTMAPSDAPVLITGESGSGKELVARTLHQLSPRRIGPFVAVNCAALPETLLEAELFGHERGAFTGALRRREGRFRAATGGTLLLDEIAEMPVSAQAKLLRVLQESTVELLGTNEPVRVDIRVVSATNRDIKQRVAEGRFREDLYYRLNVLGIQVPPLRERRSEIPLLIQHFLRRHTPAGQEPPELSPRVMALITQYPFPGNVRELSHAIEHAVVLSRGQQIDLEHLPADMTGGVEPGRATQIRFRPLASAAREFEREYLLRAISLAGGKRGRAAILLGISRKTLWEKLRHHGISV